MHKIILITKTLLEYLLMLCLLVMVLINFADVLGRHLFNHPLYGIHDLTEHLMALIVFCGLPMVTMASLHLTVDLFDKQLQAPSMRWWQYVTTVLIAVILVLMAWTFLQSAREAQAIADVSPELRLPRGPLYILMSVSALLSALGLLYQQFLSTQAPPGLSTGGGDL